MLEPCSGQWPNTSKRPASDGGLYHYTTTLVTFETRQRVYRAPFISEYGNFDLSTALFHVTMSHGKSVQAPIRL